MLPPQTFYTQVVHEKGQKLQIWTWAPYRVQCPCLKSQHQLSWILLTFATAIMGTLSKTVRFPLYPSQWVLCVCREEESRRSEAVMGSEPPDSRLPVACPRRDNHTGCICFTFLHCLFAGVKKVGGP